MEPSIIDELKDNWDLIEDDLVLDSVQTILEYAEGTVKASGNNLLFQLAGIRSELKKLAKAMKDAGEEDSL